LPTGPIDPSPFVMTLDGSEDLAFDGKGHIAAKRGAEIVLVDAVGQAAHLADLPDNVFGLRYRADGSLVAAVFGQGQLAEIAPNGQVGVLASGFGLPNGVFPDAQGNVWVTETSANKVSRVNPDKSTTVVVPTAPTANGVVLDETRHVLFYTDYAAGKLMRVDTAGASSPTLVGTVTDGKLDGLVLDECGNVYAVDQGNSKLYRFELDAAGDAKGEAKLLATFPKNVANAQFGSGPGFVATSLYVTGTPGTIYELPVGVKGAAVVTPP
jgi:sugar lactone lactonase YvrE